MYHAACQLARAYIELVNDNPARVVQQLNRQLGGLVQKLQAAARMKHLGKGAHLSTAPESPSSDIPSKSDYDGVSEGRKLLKQLRDLPGADEAHSIILNGFQDVIRLSRRSLGPDDDISQRPRFNPRLSIAILHDRDRFPEWQHPKCAMFAPVGFRPQFESADCVSARIKWDQRVEKWLDKRQTCMTQRGETRAEMRDVYDTRRGLRRGYNDHEKLISYSATERGFWFHCGGEGVLGQDGGPCKPSCCPVHRKGRGSNMSRSTSVNQINSAARESNPVVFDTITPVI